jgi:uncharacterized protein (DUF1778 family)
MRTPTRRREERLVQRAAAVRRQSISAFILDSGISAAEEALADRQEFQISAKSYDAFVAALDAPAKPKPRLDKLLRGRSTLE